MVAQSWTHGSGGKKCLVHRSASIRQTDYSFTNMPEGNNNRDMTCGVVLVGMLWINCVTIYAGVVEPLSVWNCGHGHVVEPLGDVVAKEGHMKQSCVMQHSQGWCGGVEWLCGTRQFNCDSDWKAERTSCWSRMPSSFYSSIRVSCSWLERKQSWWWWYQQE